MDNGSERAPGVINVGLDVFADALDAQGVSVVRVAWSPPAGGDPALLAILDRLEEA